MHKYINMSTHVCKPPIEHLSANAILFCISLNFQKKAYSLSFKSSSMMNAGHEMEGIPS